ncbi:hypothetical protein NDN08_002129 [Rhodosorus marinus]|uniref:VWFC domain-containing protein n=1 Tax=Rhodosorus marinus TaxID=101924 RepID=A0AAV8UVP4_9RHOD|nr:hypothetical protein NDN08_002129 [Rhodosorus marinus]
MASYKQEDEFCGCCGGEDSCFEGNKCVPNTGSTLCAYPQAQIGFPPDYLCKCSCVDDNTCTDPATGNCIPVADFVCIIDQWSPLRAEDGTCTCDGLRCPEGECLRQESAPPGSCTTTGVTCDSAGILSRAFDGQRCICCNDFDTEVVCIRKTDNICILVSDFPCPDGEIPASFSNKLCTCVPQIACRQTLSSVAC